MGQLYSSATAVLSWLGTCDEETVADVVGPQFGPRYLNATVLPEASKITDATETLAMILGKKEIVALLSSNDLSASVRIQARLKIMAVMKELSLTFSKVYWGISRVWLATYWSRVWVVQEVMLSKQIEYFAGNHVMSRDYIDFMHVFLAAFEEMCMGLGLQSVVPSRKEHRRITLVYCTYHSLVVRFKAFGVYQGRHRSPSAGKHWSFQSLLDNFGDHSCTFLHDKVFALLGMADDRHLYDTIELNYDLTLPELLSTLVSCPALVNRIQLGRKLLQRLKLNSMSRRRDQDDHSFFAWAASFWRSWQTAPTKQLDTMVKVTSWYADRYQACKVSCVCLRMNDGQSDTDKANDYSHRCPLHTIMSSASFDDNIEWLRVTPEPERALQLFVRHVDHEYCITGVMDCRPVSARRKTALSSFVRTWLTECPGVPLVELEGNSDLDASVPEGALTIDEEEASACRTIKISVRSLMSILTLDQCTAHWTSLTGLIPKVMD
jgi:hypothetical protein